MIQFAIIGIGAGVAAALLFASVTSGIWLSVPLFYLAPLPIMIAGLGWSHWAALIASLTGALTLGSVFGVVFLFAFLAGAGIPAWWLGYLAMLARPGTANGAGGRQEAALEWYPPGRLVIWAALLATLVVIVAIPNFGTDAESFRAGLRGALNTVLRAEIATPADAPSGMPAKADRLIEFLVSAIPLAAAVLATITNLFNLWLAARIVKFSGRLARPWPQLSDLRFPPLLTAALGSGRRLEFRRRIAWNRRRYRVSKSAARLRRARLCGAARHDARPADAPLPARPGLCRRVSHRLADPGALLARPHRHRI